MKQTHVPPKRMPPSPGLAHCVLVSPRLSVCDSSVRASVTDTGGPGGSATVP